MNSKMFSNFYIRSSLFTVLSLLGAIISYSIYPVLAHILTASKFGDFTVIIATSNQILALLLALNVVSIYLVKNFDESIALAKAQTIQKVLIWLFLTVTVLVALVSPFLSHFFKIENSGYFIILSLILLFSVPASIWTGYLQGHKELVRIGFYSLVVAIGKLLFVSVLAISFDVIGGLWGFLVGMIVGLAALRLFPGRTPPKIGLFLSPLTPSEKATVRSLKTYIIQSVFVVGGLGLLQNYDLTLAKILFGPAQAGIYSGISILSNALYFALFLLIWIVLPEIRINDKVGNARVMRTSFVAIAAIGLFVLVFEIIFKQGLTSLLLGNSFGGQGSTLIFASLYQITLVAVTLYAYYLLVLRSRRSIVLAASVFLFVLTIPALLASSPLSMIVLLWLSVLMGIFLYSICTHIILKRYVTTK
jgi:O-antigen/teichoic acid export membrane protein